MGEKIVNSVSKNIFEGVEIDTWSLFGGNKLLLLIVATIVYGVLLGLLLRMRFLRWIPNQIVRLVVGAGFLAIFYFWITKII